MVRGSDSNGDWRDVDNIRVVLAIRQVMSRSGIFSVPFASSCSFRARRFRFLFPGQRTENMPDSAVLIHWSWFRFENNEHMQRSFPVPYTYPTTWTQYRNSFNPWREQCTVFYFVHSQTSSKYPFFYRQSCDTLYPNLRVGIWMAICMSSSALHLLVYTLHPLHRINSTRCIVRLIPSCHPFPCDYMKMNINNISPLIHAINHKTVRKAAIKVL